MFTQLQQRWQSILKTLFDKAMSSEIQKAGLQAATIRLSFGEIAYLHRGFASKHEHKKAPTVIMLHGAGADKESWLRFAQKLPAHYQLIIPDLPAHGDSGYDSSYDYGIQSQSERLAEFIRHFKLQQVHLVGNSMGGAIAMRLAHLTPDTFQSLCLIDTAGAESEKGWLQLETMRTGKNPMMEINSVDDYKTMMQIGMSKPPYIPSVFLPLLAKKRIDRKTQDAHVMRDIVLDMDQRQILDQLLLPTLIVWGALDKIMHVNDANFLAQKLHNCETLIIPDVGHVPMVEAPTLVAQRYAEFLESL